MRIIQEDVYFTTEPMTSTTFTTTFIPQGTVEIGVKALYFWGETLIFKEFSSNITAKQATVLRSQYIDTVAHGKR